MRPGFHLGSCCLMKRLIVFYRAVLLAYQFLAWKEARCGSVACAKLWAVNTGRSWEEKNMHNKK